MKTFTLFLFLMLSQFILFSQDKSISLGAAFEYNHTTELAGINLRGYYNIGHNFCFGPEFTFFENKQIILDDEIEDISIWELNINAHYIIEIKERVGIYPIVGFNFTRETEEISYLSSSDTKTERESFYGFNLGGGIHVPIKKFTPFYEYHYTFGELGEGISTAGIFYTFGREE